MRDKNAFIAPEGSIREKEMKHGIGTTVLFPNFFGSGTHRCYLLEVEGNWKLDSKVKSHERRT